MTDQLPLSVQAELAEARATADRVRRLEAELQDAESSVEEFLRKLVDAMTERDALQAKLDGASKVIAEMAETRDRLQGELGEAQKIAKNAVGRSEALRRRMLADTERWTIAVSETERERDAALREAQRMTIQLSASLRTALREVAILRESQRLVPQGLTPKHPTCECAKMPRLHAYDPRSCTAAGDESMRRDG